MYWQMYALPEDFDPAVLLGCELERVCFPPFGIELRFDTFHLKVFGPLVLDGQELRDDGRSADAVAQLTTLPGHRVVTANVEGRGTLVLGFDGGQTLGIIEDGDAYECYILKLGDKEIIV